MNDVVIRAKGLGKRYVIGHRPAESDTYTSLRDVIVRSGRRILRSTKDMLRGRQIVRGVQTEEFWALKDVNFEIMRGEVVGIIGHNGAGKSTLLKVLSRITDPTEGQVEIRGRVASLLEVGTGFHPELTGRENILLNGAILGMTRAEVRRKFDEIVDFAGVRKFIDTPVKRYSSGMYVRLAFAVAAHLEPEILIIDEVLAVGDAEFQSKCLGKMSEVAGRGRTVLFVSHNMTAIRSMCQTAMSLSQGSASPKRPAAQVVDEYITSARSMRSVEWSGKSYDNPYFVPTSLSFDAGVIRLRGVLRKYHKGLVIGFEVLTPEGQVLFWTLQKDCRELDLSSLERQTVQLEVTFPQNLLNRGTYDVRLYVFIHNQEHLIKPGNGPSISIDLEPSLAAEPHFLLPRPGLLSLSLEWSATNVE